MAHTLPSLPLPLSRLKATPSCATHLELIPSLSLFLSLRSSPSSAFPSVLEMKNEALSSITPFFPPPTLPSLFFFSICALTSFWISMWVWNYILSPRLIFSSCFDFRRNVCVRWFLVKILVQVLLTWLESAIDFVSRTFTNFGAKAAFLNLFSLFPLLFFL